MEAQPNDYMSELPNELTEMLELVVLPEESGTHKQCIYKVPQKIRRVNPQAYTPQIISIGPFHSPLGSNSDKNHLQEMEGIKLKYLKGFLNRTNISVDNLFSEVIKWEKKIKKCYAGLVNFDRKEFLKIIMVDACFIIEFFLRRVTTTNWMENDPILMKRWLHNDIFSDLILIENQIPFFVLEEIYKVTNLNLQFPSFITITLCYFEYFNKQNLDSEGMCPKHFTDLLRTFLLLSPSPSLDFDQKKTQHVYSVSELSEAGLEFELSQSKCLLDLKFDKGVLQIPCFHVDDFTEKYTRNIIAYEECHFSYGDPRYVTEYFTMLEFLINTEKDVSILVDKKIIVNWVGDTNEAATMVNNLCKNVIVPSLNLNYQSLCCKLNDFYENPRNKYKATFVHEYLNTPWKIASTITAILLLLFTLIQVVCSIWSLKITIYPN